MEKADFIERYIEEIMRRGMGFSREEAEYWAEKSYNNDPNEKDIPYVVSEDIHAAID